MACHRRFVPTPLLCCPAPSFGNLHERKTNAAHRLYVGILLLIGGCLRPEVCCREKRGAVAEQMRRALNQSRSGHFFKDANRGGLRCNHCGRIDEESLFQRILARQYGVRNGLGVDHPA